MPYLPMVTIAIRNHYIFIAPLSCNSDKWAPILRHYVRSLFLGFCPVRLYPTECSVILRYSPQESPIQDRSVKFACVVRYHKMEILFPYS
jgi:hypothetical protein